jgi:TonB family protein
MIKQYQTDSRETGLLTVAIAVATSICSLAGSPPGAQVADWVTYSPLPKYPSFAELNILRRSHGGFFGYFPDRNPNGIFVLRVHIRTGRVKEVMVARTTGERTLDAETVKALRQWRFKPSALPHIKEIWLGRDMVGIVGMNGGLSLMRLPISKMADPLRRTA